MMGRGSDILVVPYVQFEADATCTAKELKWLALLHRVIESSMIRQARHTMETFLEFTRRECAQYQVPSPSLSPIHGEECCALCMGHCTVYCKEMRLAAQHHTFWRWIMLRSAQLSCSVSSTLPQYDCRSTSIIFHQPVLPPTSITSVLSNSSA